jgi:hypothetical protein
VSAAWAIPKAAAMARAISCLVMVVLLEWCIRCFVRLCEIAPPCVE